MAKFVDEMAESGGIWWNISENWRNVVRHRRNTAKFGENCELLAESGGFWQDISEVWRNMARHWRNTAKFDGKLRNFGGNWRKRAKFGEIF